jgi:hypothetical protein
MGCFRVSRAVLFAGLAVQTGLSGPTQNTGPPKSEESSFSVAVWYGGGRFTLRWSRSTTEANWKTINQ